MVKVSNDMNRPFFQAKVLGRPISSLDSKTTRRTSTSFRVLIVGMAIVATSTVAAQVAHGTSSNNTAARIAFSHALPYLDGAHLKAAVVEITYGPGESSPPHSHPCPVVGYVIQGALRTQVRGEAAAVYKRGQSFYEAPHGVHLISANASNQAPVKFLAFLVCGSDQPLTVAPPEAPTLGGKKP
jgi:quercetin dioxygenase-like cupin family protein